MAINVLALITAALLGLSPFITRFALLNQLLGLSNGPGIGGDYKWVVASLGGGTFLLSLYNLYIRRRSGMIFIVIGAASLVIGYFHNNEKFYTVPVHNLLFGGSEFLAFITSGLLVILGLVQEFLLGSD